jgi:hypothetical protein
MEVIREETETENTKLATLWRGWGDSKEEAHINRMQVICVCMVHDAYRK